MTDAGGVSWYALEVFGSSILLHRCYNSGLNGMGELFAQRGLAIFLSRGTGYA